VDDLSVSAVAGFLIDARVNYAEGPRHGRSPLTRFVVIKKRGEKSDLPHMGLSWVERHGSVAKLVEKVKRRQDPAS
jgi:hypothetical protein